MPLFLLLFCFFFSFSFFLLRHFSRPALRPDCSSSGNSVRSWSWSCVSETRFLIDFRQTTDLKNATRYEQKIKKRKKRKKTVKIASSKKKEGKYASQRRQPRRPQKMSSARKKKRSTTSMSMMPAATQQRRRSEQRLCVCVFAVCYQQVALWGGRAACVNCDDDGDCDVDVANLDLDLETHWRFWGELGAFYGCVLLLFLFFACFSSLFFSFFFCTFLGTRF